MIRRDEYERRIYIDPYPGGRPGKKRPLRGLLGRLGGGWVKPHRN